MSARPSIDAETIHPTSLTAWRRWLEHNHGRTAGVWVIGYKKATGKPRIEYDEAVCEALCWGWIDSLPRALDDERSMLWYAPRKPRTNWSALNQRRVARMTAEGRMRPAGLAKVEAAKRDGTWNALDAVEALEIPSDLARALKVAGRARENFDAFPRSTKRGILEWITNAKRPETRAKRIAETARLAANGERANQWRP